MQKNLRLLLAVASVFGLLLTAGAQDVRTIHTDELAITNQPKTAILTVNGSNVMAAIDSKISLDQTSPQTITGGSPLFDTGYNPSLNLEVATKGYVDDAAMSAERLDDGTNIISAAAVASLFEDSLTYVIDGCQCAWSGSGLAYDCSTGRYQILGVAYSVAATNITLSAADETNPRFDRLAVTTNSTWTQVIGTPASNPLEPEIDVSEMIARQTVLIAANATTPSNAVFISVYAENVEWTASTNNASITTVSTASPRQGSVSVNAASAQNNNYVQFDNGSTVDMSGVAILNLFIKSKAQWPQQKTLVATFRNAAGSQIGTVVTIGDNRYGFQSGVTNVYQQIVIPIGAFQLGLNDLPRILRFTVNGAAAAIGFFMDDVSLQKGVTVQTLQNILQTVEGDTGSYTAQGSSDRFRIIGGTNTRTRVSGNTLTVDEIAATYPVFRLPLGGSYTDFELKGSTNNFASEVHAYYLVSSGTNEIADDQSAFVYYTDSGAADVRKWIKATNGVSINSQIVDTNSIVGYVMVYPSVQASWLNRDNTNLVWSWVRFDGVAFELDAGGRQIWNPIEPQWRKNRVQP
jgi:hypothetical protein